MVYGSIGILPGFHYMYVAKNRKDVASPDETAVANPQEEPRLSQRGLPNTVGTRQKIRSIVCLFYTKGQLDFIWNLYPRTSSTAKIIGRSIGIISEKLNPIAFLYKSRTWHCRTRTFCRRTSTNTVCPLLSSSGRGTKSKYNFPIYRLTIISLSKIDFRRYSTSDRCLMMSHDVSEWVSCSLWGRSQNWAATHPCCPTGQTIDIFWICSEVGIQIDRPGLVAPRSRDGWSSLLWIEIVTWKGGYSEKIEPNRIFSPELNQSAEMYHSCCHNPFPFVSQINMLCFGVSRLIHVLIWYCVRAFVSNRLSQASHPNNGIGIFIKYMKSITYWPWTIMLLCWWPQLTQ